MDSLEVRELMEMLGKLSVVGLAKVVGYATAVFTGECNRKRRR